MVISLLALLIGFGLDLLIGDPHNIPHPIRLIGWLIASLERLLRRIFPKTAAGERAGGVLLVLLVLIFSAGVPLGLLLLAEWLHPLVRLLAESVMCWQILAAKSLRDESMKVYRALCQRDIAGARYAVSMIVGRDTEVLDEAGITRAAVETVAENTSDGVIAPMFYLAIGGATLGFFYKAVNTMDSMVGYLDDRYREFGWAAAKLDDLLNFLPARISAFWIIAASAPPHFNRGNARKIFFRDRQKHASPNSAQTEAACAGALQIQLAGDAFYHGVLHKKPWIGDSIRPIEPEDIVRVNELMYRAAGMNLAAAATIKLLICLLLEVL